MRIRILQKPRVASIDGIRLDRFQPGQQYEVGNTLAGVLLSEGWAEPVAPTDDPAVVIPFSELEAGARTPPPNLTREMFPPYYDAPPALAAERRRRPRRRAQ